MGIRQNQVFGLNDAARQILAREGVIAYENGESFEGYFDEKYPLHNWVAPNEAMNRISAQIAQLEEQVATAYARREQLAKSAPLRYAEYVQDVVYSSGPCFFLALRDASGSPVQATLWPQSEIEAA